MRAWRLTRREREVARLVIDGLSTEDIATALFISVHTVRDHLKMIFGKMGVSRRQGHGRRPHRKNTHRGPRRPVTANAARATWRIARGLWAKTLNATRRAPSTTTTPGPGSQSRASRPPDRVSWPETDSQRNAVLSPIRWPVTGHTVLDARSIQRDYGPCKIVMRSLSRRGTPCSSRYVIPAMAPGGTGRPAGRWVVAAARLRAPSRAAGPEAGAGAMAEWACCGQHTGNTVGELAKINTPVTRTRRHSPAHGGTIARMGMQAQ